MLAAIKHVEVVAELIREVHVVDVNAYGKTEPSKAPGPG